MRFPAAKLLPQSSGISDHCPLLLVDEGTVKTNSRFRYEGFWELLTGFKEVVAQAWNVDVGHRSPVSAFDLKLRCTKQALKLWSKNHIGDIQKQLSMLNEIILQLETAQDDRQLSASEVALRSDLKAKTLGLSVLLKIKRRQRSRITWLKSGDANTRFFHRKANSRHRKNLIHSLQSDHGVVTSHEDMLQLAHQHFDQIMGTTSPAQSIFNWEELGLQAFDLSDMETPFSLEEIKLALDDLPRDKAPGPDGFSGGFYKSCWDIIRTDVHAAFHQIFHLDARGLRKINSSLIALIPKKNDAVALNDFRPISLIHSLIKLFTKVLARRLAPKLQEMVAPCQSAFIKNRCIQENYLYVQNMARFFHRTKKPVVLLKLDLAKAFDSVSWSYLLDMLRARGFGDRWREWIAMLLASSSSQVLINGIPSHFVLHRRGLRQGDPLSPFLFILAMEPLHRILDLATSQGMLSKLPGRMPTIRASLYADDVAIFISPSRRDANFISMALHCFGEVSGLVTNPTKSSAMPIRCNGMDLNYILQPLNFAIKGFPCTYLGMPLSLRSLRKIDFQVLLDKIDALLAAWKGSMISREGRLVLLKAVLSSLTIYMMTVHKFPAWVIEKIEQRCRAWFWRGEGTCHGGHCRVKWDIVCRPKELGGLGVHDLRKFSRALRLRWLWTAWRHPDRPWVGTPLPCDAKDRQLFAVATEITLGSGTVADFWCDRWLHGYAPRDIAPTLFKIASRKHRSVKEALTNHRWILDLSRGLQPEMVQELTNLAALVDDVILDERTPDAIRWRFDASGEYTASSAYLLQFEGSIPSDIAPIIWEGWAPGKCRFFLWTAEMNKILTADVLQRRGWENEYFCQLCFRNLETPFHLLVECSWAREVWSMLAHIFRLTSVNPNSWGEVKTVREWLRLCVAGASENDRKGAHSLIMLSSWEIWRERNRRIFQHEELSVVALVRRIRDEATIWKLAGASFPFDPG
jgi:mannosylglycoprotein endo-beta-mannosidase